MNYKAYTLFNINEISQFDKLSKEQIYNINTVSRVLPFKTNNYVTEQLIDWQNYEDDPLFLLNFPQKEMLKLEHFISISQLIDQEVDKHILAKAVQDIRNQLNPHPSGQLEYNIPYFKGNPLNGIQHKYKETMLFFPSQGQTCHAYCTFCFRWPQFTGMSELKIAMKQIELVVDYLKAHSEITDFVFTGGDPMVMNAKILGAYIDALINSDIPHLKNIRIGTKSLAFWPYRYLTDPDSDEILRLFERVVSSGKHLAIMAHFNHYRELETIACINAINRIRSTGAEIRTQSPILNHINNDPGIWITMWKKQVNLGLIPYYMFVSRETGAQDYFALPLVSCYNIFKEAYSKVSGICRTARGPSMSANAGKIIVMGVPEIYGKKVIALSFIQGRNPDWVLKPFFAEYDEEALWINDLIPAFGEEEFFYQYELNSLQKSQIVEDEIQYV